MKRSDFLKLLSAGALGYQFSSVNGLCDLNPTTGEFQLNAHFVHRGPGLGRRIAMTFDDGPSPRVTEVVLKELAKRNITATFFMIGNKVERYASLAKEVASAGHELGNHSYTHPPLNTLSAAKVEYELEKTQEAIHAATGKVPVWFRPPYGAFRNDQGSIPRAKSLGVAYWSVDPRDWSKPGASVITSRVTRMTNPGSIVLLHDLHSQTADAVGSILDNLMESSFSFSQLSGFLGDPYGPSSKTALAAKA
jgi:peptidoglycan/xylan/chitin deacetylase (PgdA/CDA1 family)